MRKKFIGIISRSSTPSKPMIFEIKYEGGITDILVLTQKFSPFPHSFSFPLSPFLKNCSPACAAFGDAEASVDLSRFFGHRGLSSVSTGDLPARARIKPRG